MAKFQAIWLEESRIKPMAIKAIDFLIEVHVQIYELGFLFIEGVE